jgi:extradiol dioxygenase family protein
MSMFTKAGVTTILPVKDLARARDFYANKLGLEPKGFAATGTICLHAEAMLVSRSSRSLRAPRLNIQH